MTNTDTSRRAFTKGMLAAAADAALAPDVTLADSPQTAPTGDIVGHGDFRYRVHREWGDLARPAPRSIIGTRWSRTPRVGSS